jgi:hypothetical protein
MENPAERPDQPTTGSTAADVIGTGLTGQSLRAASRFGLVARGVVYLLVGYLSLRLALDAHGRSDQPASAAGAVQQVAQHSWGAAPLVLLAAGFAGYALTQLVEAIFRPRYAGSAINRWRQRAVSMTGFLLYTAFCVSTISLLVTLQRPDGTARSERRQDTALTADALRTVPGRLVLGVVGLLVVLAGVELGRRSMRLTFQERFVSRLDHRFLGLAVRSLGALGCVARAAVFALVGVFVLKAAISGNPWESRGLDATFRGVAHSTYGPITLGALAVGLACYGLYCLIEARYRDLTPGR